jgi:hypothetical protein
LLGVFRPRLSLSRNLLDTARCFGLLVGLEVRRAERGATEARRDGGTDLVAFLACFGLRALDGAFLFVGFVGLLFLTFFLEGIDRPSLVWYYSCVPYRRGVKMTQKFKDAISNVEAMAPILDAQVDDPFENFSDEDKKLILYGLRLLLKERKRQFYVGDGEALRAEDFDIPRVVFLLEILC